MSTFERKVLTGSMWVPEMKTLPNAPDFGGRIKVPACTEEMENIISVWDNRERKNSPKSPDYGIKLKILLRELRFPMVELKHYELVSLVLIHRVQIAV